MPPETTKLMRQGTRRVMAERVGFEPTVPLPGQLLSRQPDSAALAPLRKISAIVYHAEDGTRTRTGFHPQAPQACVSTNSTTSAS